MVDGRGTEEGGDLVGVEDRTEDQFRALREGEGEGEGGGEGEGEGGLGYSRIMVIFWL